MKEYSFPLTKAFENGLRPEIFTGSNLEVLTKSLNAVPGRGGLVRVGSKASAYPTIASDFPFPQLFFFRDFTLMGTRSGLYELQDDGTWKQVVTALVSDVWDVLDFGPYVLAVNDGRVWERVIDTGAYSLVSDVPTFTCIDNFKGQLVAGGYLEVGGGGSITSYQHRVTWGKIGTKDFTVDRRNQAGYAELLESGFIMNVKALDEGFVAYAENSVTWFFPVSSPVNTFGQKQLLDYGVSSKGSVCRGKNMHLAVMVNGDVYEIANGAVSYKGFAEFFDSFGSTVVSYNSNEDEFYICNGKLTYVYKNGKLGEIGQVITSASMFEGTTYVMSADPSDETYEVVTGKVDMGTRGMKTLYAIEASIETAEPASIQVHWMSDIKHKFRTSSWIPLGPTGIATFPISGIEFKIGVKVSNVGYVNLSALNIRWKLTDKRSIRGRYAN